MASHVLSEIFDKLTSADKDYRFMATSDLLTELQKETMRMDTETERRVCLSVLQRMQDSAGEISEIAVKCLSVLLPKIQETSLNEVLQILLDGFLSEKKEHEGQEMANLGLKTVIETIPSHSPAGATVIRGLTPRLIQGMQTKNDEIVLTSLDVSREFVMKFGSALEKHGETMLVVFLDLLKEPRLVVRKKAISCIGVLSLSLTDAKLNELITSLLESLDNSQARYQMTTSFVQAIGVISYMVGNRMGAHIAAGVDSMMQRIANATDEDIEALESCIRVLETFISRSPLFARPYLDQIIDVCIKFLHFDPNYADDMDASGDEETMMEDDEDGYSDDEAYSDDEDESWKVRKASASCLTAVFNHNIEQIDQIYQKVGPVLISRFAEREENVKLDVLAGYICLLHRVRYSVKSYGNFDVNSVLGPSVPTLIKMIGKQVNDKSVKTRLQAFRVLKETAAVLPDHIVGNIQNFVQAVSQALKEGSSATSDLKIEVLSFLRVAMHNSKASELQSTLPQLAPVVFDAVGERYYKVTSEALRVCNAMVHIIRPSPENIVDDALTGLIPSLFHAVMRRLNAQDVDQEVKEYAIKCIADVIALLGDVLADEVEPVLHILLERLKSETTRLTAVKALTTVGASVLKLDLNSIISPLIMELTVFLKKANVTLRQAALHALDVFCSRSGEALSDDAVQGIITEAAALVSDQDLHLASNSLDLLCTLAQVCPRSKSQIKDLVLSRALELVQSPLLQGTVLISLEHFFVSMADHFDQLLRELMAEVPGKVQQQSTARCVAALCCQGDPSKLSPTVQTLIEVAEKERSEAMRRLALLSLGEIGRLTSLSSYPKVEALLTQSLDNASEDMQSSASHALGALTLGNLPQFLPGLVDKIQSNRGHQRQLYLLLLSLNEVIGSLNQSEPPMPLSEDHVVGIRDMLLSSEDFEEDCRNVAAECVGQLALLHPDVMLPSLKNNINSPSENIRYMIVSGIRYTFVDKPHAVDQELLKSMALYLQSLTDGSRHVRKAAVQLLSSALAQKPQLVQDCLQDVLQKLYDQTEKKQELIRVLDFGPFKHRIDDGVELRKATFECMNLLLDVAPSRLNIQEFLQHLRKGLADENDIKLLCYPMLIKLCSIAEAAIIAEIDRIIDPIQKTLTKVIAQDAVKHERERHQELVRSCLKAVDALGLIEGMLSQKGFKRMMDSVVHRGDMKTVFQEIQKERTEAVEEQKTSQDQAHLFTVLNRGISGSMSF